MAHLGFGDPIKQYPGQVHVMRAVKVLAPGKHFNNDAGGGPKQSYSHGRALRNRDIKKRCVEFCPNALRNGVSLAPRSGEI